MLSHTRGAQGSGGSPRASGSQGTVLLRAGTTMGPCFPGNGDPQGTVVPRGWRSPDKESPQGMGAPRTRRRVTPGTVPTDPPWTLDLLLPPGPLRPMVPVAPMDPPVPVSPPCHIRRAGGPGVAGQQRRDGPPVPPRLFRTLYPQQTRHGHGPPQASARDKAVAEPACPQPTGLGHLNTALMSPHPRAREPPSQRGNRGRAGATPVAPLEHGRAPLALITSCHPP